MRAPALTRALWSTRLVVVVAVLGSFATSLAVFYLATADTIHLFGHLRSYADPSLDVAARKTLHSEAIVQVVEIIDGYLLATILLIFALGLFELFVSPLHQPGAPAAAPGVLSVRDLDDLKNRLGKVVIIIMIVTFFEEVVIVDVHTPIDLLFVGAGIALVGLTLKLTHSGADGH